MMEDTDHTRYSILLSTSSYKRSSFLGTSPHCCRGQNCSCCSPTPSPTRGGQAELPCLSCCSSQGRTEAENSSAAVLQMCFNADLNCLQRGLVDHLPTPCVLLQPITRTHSQEELRVLEKKRMKLCAFALLDGSGLLSAGLPTRPLPASTMFTHTKPGCVSPL